jgi:hypothetical protein
VKLEKRKTAGISKIRTKMKAGWGGGNVFKESSFDLRRGVLKEQFR